MNGIRLSVTSRRTCRTVTPRCAATSSIVRRTGNSWTVAVAVGAISVVMGIEGEAVTSRITTRITTRVDVGRRERNYPAGSRGTCGAVTCGSVSGGAVARVRAVDVRHVTSRRSRPGRASRKWHPSDGPRARSRVVRCAVGGARPVATADLARPCVTTRSAISEMSCCPRRASRRSRSTAR